MQFVRKTVHYNRTRFVKIVQRLESLISSIYEVQTGINFSGLFIATAMCSTSGTRRRPVVSIIKRQTRRNER